LDIAYEVNPKKQKDFTSEKVMKEKPDSLSRGDAETRRRGECENARMRGCEEVQKGHEELLEIKS
jgi:hypothetical protein